MTRVVVCAAGVSLLSLLIVTGCSPWAQRVGDYNCNQLTEYFHGQPPNVRMAQFARADLEKQYAIYICGQRIEPPEMELAEPFAREGGRVVKLLKNKLSHTTDDITIRDIVLVLTEMNRQRTYDVAGDRDLMRIVDDRVAAMEDPFWKRWVKDRLKEIRATHTAG